MTSRSDYAVTIGESRPCAQPVDELVMAWRAVRPRWSGTVYARSASGSEEKSPVRRGTHLATRTNGGIRVVGCPEFHQERRMFDDRDIKITQS